VPMTMSTDFLARPSSVSRSSCYAILTLAPCLRD
jgi:hypothetical protein